MADPISQALPLPVPKDATDRIIHFKRKLLLLGPAFIAAIGYIDPGNFATNIEAGSSFDYKLLWVVLWANLMAMVSELLAAKAASFQESSLSH